MAHPDQTVETEEDQHQGSRWLLQKRFEAVEDHFPALAGRPGEDPHILLASGKTDRDVNGQFVQQEGQAKPLKVAEPADRLQVARW